MAITIDGTNGLTSDNAALKLDGTTLVVDDTNNRVGIGTASPSSTLHVVGSQLRLQTNNCSHQFYNTAGSRYAYLEAASGGVVLDVESGGGSKFIVKSSGSEKIQVNQYGLCFNGDTAAANALDDYEEGTWTPVLSRTGSSYTFSNQAGIYTKVGNIVTCTFGIQITAIGTQGSSYNVLSGFPFTPASYGGAGRFQAVLSYKSVLTSSTALYWAGAWFFTDGSNALQTNFTTGELNGTVSFQV